MRKTYGELLAEAGKSVCTIPLDELKVALEQGAGIALVDVREKEETQEGYIPGAMLIPRGFLEMQIEQRLPDRGASVVVY
ncbi:MAG: molybdopterin biosynthesis protein MoeB, partial [Myxococcales bacterium]|nr:molybdopterin biosynthesis protein MoeB [Polyangiaceae bacterium]MDW8251772.1 molybdopterin biosynthesis protein MoeB [Myxococcales bacterium]